MKLTLKRLMVAGACAAWSLSIVKAAAAQDCQGVKCGEPCVLPNGEPGFCWLGGGQECNRCVPTVSQWGAVNMGVMLLAAGTVAVRTSAMRRAV